MITHAFIFARGGSKGLPEKNILPLVGKPLILHTIEFALKIPIFEKVFVSTDNSRIAHLAKSAGAIVINRPIELAQDDSPEWESWKHAINWTKKHYGNFQEFVSLSPTSPLRIREDVELAIQEKVNVNADVCLAITPSSHNPFFNMVKRFRNNQVEILNKPDNMIFHRQDAPEVFDITTVVYVASVEFILKSNNIFEGVVTSIVIPKERAIDIDDIHDFNFAEFLLTNNLDKE